MGLKRMISIPTRVAAETDNIFAHPFDCQPLIEKTDILLNIRGTRETKDSKTVTEQIVSRILERECDINFWAELFVTLKLLGIMRTASQISYSSQLWKRMKRQ